MEVEVVAGLSSHVIYVLTFHHFASSRWDLCGYA